MQNVKNNVGWIILIVFTVPLILYPIDLWVSVFNMISKEGWNERPHVLISLNTIIVYVIYSLSAQIILLWLHQFNYKKKLMANSIACGLGLFIFWIGFLTHAFSNIN